MNSATPCSKTDSYSNGDSRNLFLEYELDFEPKGECYVTIDGTSYTVLARGQRFKNQSSSHDLRNDPNPLPNNIHVDQGASTSQIG